MAENFKFRDLTIQLQPGVTLHVDVSSAAEVKDVLRHLKSEGLFTATVGLATREAAGPVTGRAAPPAAGDDPASLIETRASLALGSLASANVIAFKDNVPQLLRPNIFAAVSDAALALLFAVEAGLKTRSISFEDFKDLYDGQNIKSGTALSMLLTNLRNAGYLDKKVYTADRSVRLTAKGEKKAIEVLKSLTVPS